MKTFTKFALAFVSLTSFGQFASAQENQTRTFTQEPVVQSQPQTQTFVQPQAQRFVQQPNNSQPQALVMQPGYDQPSTYVAPPAPPMPPIRLGFDGQITCEGMRVSQVNWGSLAQQIGLEAGDIITHINGRRVRDLYTYQRLLRDAVENDHGHVDLRIKNVRANWDAYAPRFVQRHIDLPHEHYEAPVVPATIAGL